MTNAIVANLETCAHGRCCQPVERDVVHRVGHPEVADGWVEHRIGYCGRHAERVIARKLARAVP